MSSESWSERIAAERMRTDQEFAERVTASPLSSQQWSLVMTAVEFDIEGPEQPASATLVADTSRLPSVLDEIRRMDEQGRTTAPTGSAGSTGDTDGFLDALKQTLGIGGSDDELRDAAEALADEYARELQARLEDGDRWAEICELARGT